MRRLWMTVAAIAISGAVSGCTLPFRPTALSSTGSAAITATAAASRTAGSDESASPEVGTADTGSGGSAAPAQAKPAGSRHTPGLGTPERKAVLDAMRAPAEKELGRPIVFKVMHLAVRDPWAFAWTTPMRSSTVSVDYTKTRYADAWKQGFFSDGMAALLRKSGGTWRVVAYVVGPTDVAWEDWPSKYGAPPDIFGTQ